MAIATVEVTDFPTGDQLKIMELRRQNQLMKTVLIAGLAATEGAPKGAGWYVTGTPKQTLENWRNGVMKLLAEANW